MTTKNKVLNILENSKGKSISGQNLADMLFVSRTTIWKSISSLKKEGYIIEATSNKGYSLSTSCDVLSSETLRKYLLNEYNGIPIHVYKSIPSTNTEAKMAALKGATHGTVILSDEQTSGRGRLGRNFYSPAQTGIYMSIILKPKLSIANSVLITTAVAVAVCLSIDKFSDKKSQIKWVNDIYIDNKKVCGILTEAVTDFESGNIENIVVGIGLNIKIDDSTFPEELKSIAGSIQSSDKSFISRNKLAAEIINRVLRMSETLEDRDFLRIYKKRSMIIGQNIVYKRNEEWIEGFAKDIDEYGGLIVTLNNGENAILNSGEITIRKSTN